MISAQQILCGPDWRPGAGPTRFAAVGVLNSAQALSRWQIAYNYLNIFKGVLIFLVQAGNS